MLQFVGMLVIVICGHLFDIKLSYIVVLVLKSAPKMERKSRRHFASDLWNHRASEVTNPADDDGGDGEEDEFAAVVAVVVAAPCRK